MPASHPTKRHLLETVLAMLETRSPDSLTTEEVLAVSGISKGSLYHHFEDFPHLIETALVARFAAFVTTSLDLYTALLSTSPDRETLREGIRRHIRSTLAPGRAEARVERAALIGRSAANPRLRAALAAEQERLTSTSEGLVRDAVARGLLSKEHPPRALAIFIQSYTLGKVVDEITTESLDPEVWTNLIMTVVDRIFIACD